MRLMWKPYSWWGWHIQRQSLKKSPNITDENIKEREKITEEEKAKQEREKVTRKDWSRGKQAR